MATNTYVALDKVTVGTAVSSVTLNMGSTLSQAYTDLVLIGSHKNTVGIAGIAIRFNGDTDSNYSSTLLYGTGSAAGSSRYTNQTWIPVGYTSATEYAVIKCQIQNYSNSTTFKTLLSRGGSATYEEDTMAGLWRKTPEPITSITLTATGGNIAVGSTFSLYGIAAQVTPGTAKATGGTITYDQSGNVIHTFTSSGTFTPSTNLTGVEYLVVAGGGGGGYGRDFSPPGSYGAGGGGAGGLRSTTQATGGGSSLETPLSLTASTAYTVEIGAGGAGATSDSSRGSSGLDSVFSTITSTGGGGAGTVSNDTSLRDGLSGGSGGGGADSGGATGTGGSGTSGQGFAGANSQDTNENGGGGGGAGSAGTSGSSSSGGDGGTAIAVPISGSWVYYAGGGGGGAQTGRGGYGGGTATTANKGGATDGISASNLMNASAATANTGGGGGGGYAAYNGGTGGSGVVIIRYSGL
jgi:hypothetical protein